MKIESGEKEKFLLNGMGEHHSATGTAQMRMDRKIYSVRALNKETDYAKPKDKTFKDTVAKKYRKFSCHDFFLTTIPIAKWLPEYQWRRNFYKDIISGITVAIMHIPQGMAYALLANVPPIVGIYMAFFPVLVYVIFGTSRHVSMGTFAVVCLMTGKVVHQHSTLLILQNGTTIRTSNAPDGGSDYTNIEVAYTVTFTVAMFQLIMYCLRLGVIATLLSETLVSGFTCASAFHVVLSQVKDLLGLPISKPRGFFSFEKTLWDSLKALPLANVPAIIVSVITVTLLLFNSYVIKPQLKKVTSIPLPIELIAVSFGTLASYMMDLHTSHNMSIVGFIPTGLPYPATPRFELIPDIAVESFVITMVSYSITVSMGLIFGRMLHYEINFNQELLAMGLSNFVGSFFSTLPVTASLSRSMIQQSVGGVTQLTSVVSCSILLMVLLWIGPLFQTLPRAVLASIIIVALWPMVMKVREVRKYWRLSWWDGLVWLVTFFVTVMVQISLGLAAGICVSILSVFMQGHNPYNCILGVVPNTDIYLDVKRHKSIQEIEGIKIFRFCGGVSFVSKTVFRISLYKRIGLNPMEILQERARLKEKGQEVAEEEYTTRCVILDFSAITFIDPTGVSSLTLIQKDLNDIGVEMYLAGCTDPVYEKFIKCDKMSSALIQFMIFPTVHDAVLYAQHYIQHNT